MFLYVNDGILKNTNLTPTEKLVYAVIESFDYSNKSCYMSNNQLASNLGTSRIQIIRAIQNLEKLDLIKVKYTESKGVYSNRILSLKKKEKRPINKQLIELFDSVYSKIK